MQSFAVLLAAALAVASPVHKREVGGVLICTGVNATGTCSYSVNPLGTCVDVPAKLNGSTNTFAVDGDYFFCYPYANKCNGTCTSPEGCTLGKIDFSYPHKYNLSVVAWDDGLASYDCHSK